MDKDIKKTYQLLKHYYNNKVSINIRHLENNSVILAGKITKLHSMIGNPYCIIGDTKLFLEDIDCNSIFPSSVKRDESKGLNTGGRKSIPKAVRLELWANHFGDQFVGKCFCCKNEIARDNFEAGHVIPASKGGSDTPDNLRPICFGCNRSMGDQDLNEYKLQFN